MLFYIAAFNAYRMYSYERKRAGFFGSNSTTKYRFICYLSILSAVIFVPISIAGHFLRGMGTLFYNPFYNLIFLTTGISSALMAVLLTRQRREVGSCN
jgi:hypothetical protein